MGAELEEILRGIGVDPPDEEYARIRKIANAISDRAKKHAAQYSVKDHMFGGSYAKDTWLEQADVDLFVLFDVGMSDDEFEKNGIEFGKRVLEGCGPFLKYSQHPYVEGIMGGVRINIVPCFDVEWGRWRSAADRSKYHTEYMKNALDGAKRRQVRLLKRFAKCAGVYGAEIARQGFSGYVCESLITYLGDFAAVMEGFASAKPGLVLGEGNFGAPVSIADPVDDNRNLAAAISQENLGRFIIAARAILKWPSAVFFEPPAQQTPAITQIISVSFEYKWQSPDNVWGQIKKASNAVAKHLEGAGFGVIRNGAACDEKKCAALLFVLNGLDRPPVRVREGPDVFLREASERFIEHNRARDMLWVGTDRRIMSAELHEITSAELFLKNSMREIAVPRGIKNDMVNCTVRAGPNQPEWLMEDVRKLAGISCRICGD